MLERFEIMTNTQASDVATFDFKGTCVCCFVSGSTDYQMYVSYASVTFATVVVRFSCLRFSLRFFRHRRRQYATTFAFTLLTITLRFLSATTRTKPNIDLADIVRQPQGHRTVIVLSSRQPHINRTMPA